MARKTTTAPASKSSTPAPEIDNSNNQSVTHTSKASISIFDTGSSLSSLYGSRPITSVSPTLIKNQSVRSNIDRFKIEQVALRRLRFIVENNEADPSHLPIVDLVEAG